MVKPSHPHFLRAPGFLGGGAAPAVLKRTDQDFVAALLDELRTPDGRTRMAETIAKDRDAAQRLRLFQPVHRVFHLVVVEALCAEFATPRVDPARIEGAGVVVRRLVRPLDPRTGRPLALPAVPGADREVEAWSRDGDVIAGWRPLRTRDARERDPDPARRRPPLRAGHPVVTAALARPEAGGGRWGESVAPLFVAPPEVCAMAGSTVLYGVVPVTSGELVETVPAPPAPTADDEEVMLLVPASLRETGRVHVLPAVLKPDALPAGPAGDRVTDRIDELSLLRGLGVFEDAPPAREVLEHLDAVGVWPENDAQERATRTLGEVLRAGAAVFEREDAVGAGEALAWRIPTNAEWHRELRRRLAPLVNARVDEMTAGMGRYERADALYHVRAFARLRRCDGCPPELVWSAPGEPFSIVPWYEGSGAPPVKVQLPEATLASMAKLKPNVAFEVPASLQSAMSRMRVKKPLEVEKGSGVQFTVAWICGFSIPLITLCAFIVLSIFLQLLNIIFWWLPFIKICIPIPVPKGNAPSPRS